jgi:hypothetical protein
VIRKTISFSENAVAVIITPKAAKAVQSVVTAPSFLCKPALARFPMNINTAPIVKNKPVF